MNKQQLSTHLKGIANSLDKDWMDEESVYGSLLVILTSAGYLKKVKETYELHT